MMEQMKSFIAVIFACMTLGAQAQSKTLSCWTNSGKQKQLTAEGNILVLPDTIAAIDLRNVTAVTLDCSSANPNCLFYTDETTAVVGLPNANIVCDGLCDGLILSDAACFYCPITFTTTDAMLRLTPQRDDGRDDEDFSQPCHETVILPFDADMVIPADVNGPMPDGWLQAAQYVGYYNKELLFYSTDADKLKANTPYLMKFAYGAYGTQILFCGQNKTIQKTNPAISHEEEVFCLSGTTMSEEEKPTYFRYYRGEKPYFIHTGDGTPMEPFRCFMIYNYNKFTDGTGEEDGNWSTKPGNLTILEYSIIGGESESTSLTKKDASFLPGRIEDGTFDFSGRRINAKQNNKGIRIIRGKKYLK